MNFHDIGEMSGKQRLIVRAGYLESMPAFDTMAVGLKDLDFHDVFKALLLLDGTWLLDGQKTLSGIDDELAREISRITVNNNYIDPVQMNENARISFKDFDFQEQFGVPLTLDGSWALDGSKTLSGMAGKTVDENIAYRIKLEAEINEQFDTLAETLSMGKRNHHFLDGSWDLDGETFLDGMVLIPLE
jgi:hypothetical protein